jgi:hypothetical protein
MAFDVRGQHNADSHSADKETSEHLKVKQILALSTGVCSAGDPSKGREHQARLIEAGHPNLFVLVPKIHNFIWDAVMARHQKSLATCMLMDVEDKAEIFAITMLEIFRLGEYTIPLHLKIGLWHAKLIRAKSKTVIKRGELKELGMPS